MRRRNITILIFAVLALGLLLVVLAPHSGTDTTGRLPRVVHEVVPPDAGAAEDASVVGRDAWLPLQTDGSTFAALVDGQPVPATYRVGAAGRFPPSHTTGTSIALPQPAQTMSGEDVDVVEVLVQSVDGEHAYWGDLPTGAIAVEMVAAHTVRVRVVNTAQRPVVGAQVRLAREVVSLLPQVATTDEQGWATFATLPSDGVFVAAYRNFVVDVVDEATIVVPPSIEVRGTVRDPDGGAVVGATVAVFGAEHGVDPLSDLPVDIVTTDARGTYKVGGVAGAQFAVVATADDYSPAHVTMTPTLLDDLVIDVELRRGRSITARVVDERGNAVAGATVSWREPRTGPTTPPMGGTVQTDANGRAMLRSVPSLAEVSAQAAGFASGVTQLGNVEGDEVVLTLRKSDARRWRVRVELPREIALLDLIAHDGAGVRCAVETADGRDFTLTGCGEDKLMLEVLTAHGTARVETAPVDGATVVVPPPTRVELSLRGVASEDWAATSAKLRNEKTVRPVEVAGGEVATSLYPGAWTLEVSNRRVGRLTTQIEVGTATLRQTVPLEAIHHKSFQIVDAYGAPVTGAFAMLFDGDKLVDRARSGGQLPTTFSQRDPFDGTILVVDPRRGEGVLAWSANATRVELGADVLSARVPATRLTASELAEVLGSPVVVGDRGFVVDVRAGSAAATAGVVRGDRVVTAWRDSGRVRLLVARGSTLVELRL